MRTEMLKRDWVGRHVKLTREIQNEEYVFPTGLVMTVSKNHGGLSLHVIQVCACCGIGKHVRIAKVPESWVELLPVDTQEHLLPERRSQ